MPFADLYGQELVKKILRQSLREQSLPGALLFAGPDELAMKRMAVVLAQALNCLEKTDDACGVCASCQAIYQNRFPDVIEAGGEKNKKLKGLGIEEAREIRQLALMKPMIGRKRVFILEEAERMTPEAANALLKILEEPPAHVHFTLITRNPGLIIPTILSRCRLISFQPLSPEDEAKVLMAAGVPAQRAKLMVYLADGSLERGLSFDWEKVELKRKEAWDIFRRLIQGEEVLSFLQTYGSYRADRLREDFEVLMRLFLTFFRDLLLLAQGGEKRLLFNSDMADSMEELTSKVDTERCLYGVEITQEILAGLEKNLNLALLANYFYAQWRSETHG